jgi:uncharacterized membrane protein YedE/YeeE
MAAYWHSLAGGMILGLAAALLLVLNGRVAGVSGIFARLLGARLALLNGAFIVGLLAGPALHALAFGVAPAMQIDASWPVVVIAGLLVGVGTRMGSGCTSGHGILGLARLSPRSMAATAAFLVAGVVTATLMGLGR